MVLPEDIHSLVDVDLLGHRQGQHVTNSHLDGRGGGRRIDAE